MAEQNYNAFWLHRQYQILGSYPINEWKDRKAVELSTRAQRVQELQNSFFNSDIGDQLRWLDIVMACAKFNVIHTNLFIYHV